MAGNGRRSWSNSTIVINVALPTLYFDELVYPDSPRNLNSSNGPVRTRMPGSVAGDLRVYLDPPMPLRKSTEKWHVFMIDLARFPKGL